MPISLQPQIWAFHACCWFKELCSRPSWPRKDDVLGACREWVCWFTFQLHSVRLLIVPSEVHTPFWTQFREGFQARGRRGRYGTKLGLQMATTTSTNLEETPEHIPHLPCRKHVKWDWTTDAEGLFYPWSCVREADSWGFRMAITWNNTTPVGRYPFLDSQIAH